MLVGGSPKDFLQTPVNSYQKCFTTSFALVAITSLPVVLLSIQLILFLKFYMSTVYMQCYMLYLNLYIATILAA